MIRFTKLAALLVAMGSVAAVRAADEYLDVPVVKPGAGSTNAATVQPASPAETGVMPPAEPGAEKPRRKFRVFGGGGGGSNQPARPDPGMEGGMMDEPGPPPGPGEGGMRPEGPRPPRPGMENRPGLDGRKMPPRGPGQPGGMQPWFNEGRGMMELLLAVPPEQFEQELGKLPKFRDRPPEERRHLLERMRRFYEERRQDALGRAREAGIVIPPGREREWVQAFLKSQREVEVTLRKEFEPRRRQLESEAIEKLRQQFGTTNATSAAP
jgi:hypothetical protein